MNRSFLLCLLLLTACSAEVAVQTEPFDQIVPVTALLEPVYAEIAIDLPEEAQGDIVVQEVFASMTVVNPSRTLSLELSARVSLTGQARPDQPVFYTRLNLPPYFNNAAVLLPPQTFAPGQSVPVRTTGPALVDAVGKPRIWLILSNTVQRVGIGTDPLPLQVRLEGITLQATVTKPFDGLGGVLEVGGL